MFIPTKPSIQLLSVARSFSLCASSTSGRSQVWFYVHYDVLAVPFNQISLLGNSIERIQQYLVIEHEPEPTKDGVPPAYWPASGSLSVEKLSARYSETGPKVLHDVSFQVKAGERVGIVGRTGSGKVDHS